MAKTHLNALKQDAVVKVDFKPGDIMKLQAILFRHVSKQIKLDDTSWTTLMDLCERIDDLAAIQNQLESREVDL